MMSTLFFLLILTGVTLLLDNAVKQRHIRNIQNIWDNPRPRRDPYAMPSVASTPAPPSALWVSLRELLFIQLYGLLVVGIAGGLIAIVSHCLPSP